MKPSHYLPLLVAAAFLAAAAADVLGWRPPPCTFKRFTGQPCVFCGGSRAVRALAQLDPLAALAWNPLVTLAPLAVPLWFALKTVRPLPIARATAHSTTFESRPRSTAAGMMVPGRGILVACGALAVANWAYLICVGR